MIRFLLLLLVLGVSLIQGGCGGSDSAGVGNTVILTAGSTAGADTLAVSSIASLTTSENLSFDVTSTALFHDGTAQNVSGFREVISFEYQGCTEPNNFTLSAPLPVIYQYSSTSLAPGGTWTQVVGIGTPEIKQYVIDHYPTAFVSTSNILKYKVTVTFIGTETTGKSISVSTYANLWITS